MTSPSLEDLVTFAEETQEHDWHELENAIRLALNHVWSINCETYVHQIILSARLVGVTPWDQVPWPLINSGIYEHILRTIRPDQASILPTDEQLAESTALSSTHFPAIPDSWHIESLEKLRAALPRIIDEIDG